MSSESVEPRRRPKDRKQQILVQARDLFVEFGYPNVSMAQIAEKVGITAGALYRHYANKSDLLEAVVRDGFSGVVPVDPEVTRLAEAVQAAAAGAIARPDVAVLWARESRHLPPDIRDEIRAVMRDSTGGYAALLHAERPDLRLEQADLLAWAIQSVMVSPSRYTVRLAAADHARVLAAAAAGVGRARLAPVLPPVASRPGTHPLEPVSRRERLLAAAIRLFGERGYQDTSMADIGAAAQVTGPNLYGYFDSKGALLRAALERGAHALWLDLDSALRGHDDPGQALAAVVSGYVQLTTRWAGLRVETTGEADIDAGSRSAQREYVGEWVALLRESRPDLDPLVARILVHAALTVIDDLAHTPHIRRSASFPENVTAAALGALAARP